MIQLNPNDLKQLENELKIFSAFCINADNEVTKVIKDMQPQFSNDNFGTDGWTKKAPMGRIIKSLDALDNLKEYSDGLIGGIELIMKGGKQ